MELEEKIRGMEEMVLRKLDAEDPRVYGPLSSLIRQGGKRVRPRLTFHSCGACGGDYEDALESAAMIELFHLFTLVHDDVADGASTRRGAPTIHRTHGLGIAVNSGDALFNLIWGWMLCLDLEPERLLALQGRYAKNLKRVVDGQGVELEWERNGNWRIGKEEYLQMVLGKTSALMELSCGSGAFLAGAGDREIEALEGFGRAFGLAFQLMDDIRDACGQGEDIRSGKRTLLAIHALRTRPASERSELARRLGAQDKDEDEVGRIRRIMESAGSFAVVEGLAAGYVAMAKKCLGGIAPSPDREALTDLSDRLFSD